MIRVYLLYVEIIAEIPYFSNLSIFNAIEKARAYISPAQTSMSLSGSPGNHPNRIFDEWGLNR